MTGPSIDTCVAIWNGAGNAEVRAAVAAMRPREVFVGLLEASLGVTAAVVPSPRCAVFLRDPGGEGVPPSMVTITTTVDGTRFDLAGATRYEGADNTSLGGPQNAVLGKDGAMSLGSEA